jgi:hypothetical protein
VQGNEAASVFFRVTHALVAGAVFAAGNRREEAKKEIRQAISEGYSLSANDTTALKSLLGESDFKEITGAK